MERTNYTPALLDGLDDILRYQGGENASEIARQVANLKQGLHEGVKFLLPENGALVADQFSWDERHLSLMRLPYQTVVLEYPCRKDSRHENNENVPETWKQVTLAFEVEDEDGAGAAIFNFTQIPGQPWAPWLFGIMLYRDVYRSGVANGQWIKPIPITDDPSALAAQQRFTDEMAIDAAAVVNLCACLNCENVETETLPAPSKLNKRRQAKGKKPLYEYKTLRLEQERGSPVGAANGGGTHSSPRVHLRRGHIRRLSSERMIWVRPTVVGDKKQGVVHKDYQIA